MVATCSRCGGAKPQMCAPCVEQIVDRCLDRIAELQRVIARMQNDMTCLNALAADSAASSPSVEDHG